MPDNLGIDVKRLRECDDLLSNLWTDVNLHAMPHIEHLIHLAPIGSGALVDSTEEWGDREHIVLDHATVVVDKMEHLRLGAACAMHHTVNLRTQLVQKLLDDRSVGAGRREHQLTGIDG